MDRPERANDALAVLELACDLGSGGGCANFAFLYATGKIVKKDDRRATALYVKSCDLGDAKGCYNAGRDVRRRARRRPRRRRRGRAIRGRLRRRAARPPARTSASTTRTVRAFGRTPRAPSSSISADATARPASRPTSRGCVNVGRANRDGIGVAKNPARAATIFERRAGSPRIPRTPDSDENRSRACSLLGGLYLAGDGVEKDVEKGRELSELGCEGGDTFGCFNAAAVVATDPAKAAEFLDRACQRGDGEALPRPRGRLRQRATGSRRTAARPPSSPRRRASWDSRRRAASERGELTAPGRPHSYRSADIGSIRVALRAGR